MDDLTQKFRLAERIVYDEKAAWWMRETARNWLTRFERRKGPRRKALPSGSFFRVTDSR